MDGNTTATDEDEFVETLKGEMPDVFINIGLNFQQIDLIDGLVKEVEISKDDEKIKQAKSEIDIVLQKVIDSEGLVIKLEQEIIEWNAIGKLVKRDEELDEIEAAVQEMFISFKIDRKKMDE